MDSIERTPSASKSVSSLTVLSPFHGLVLTKLEDDNAWGGNISKLDCAAIKSEQRSHMVGILKLCLMCATGFTHLGKQYFVLK